MFLDSFPSPKYSCIRAEILFIPLTEFLMFRIVYSTHLVINIIKYMNYPKNFLKIGISIDYLVNQLLILVLRNINISFPHF